MSNIEDEKKEVLLKEYETRHSYNKLYIVEYEKHTNYLSLYFTIFFTFIGYIFTDKGIESFLNIQKQSTGEKQFFYLIVLFFLIFNLTLNFSNLFFSQGLCLPQNFPFLGDAGALISSLIS